jgi:hypothetical protein
MSGQPGAARSTRSHFDQRETFPPRRVGETLVERDDLERGRTAFRGHESCRKL